MRHLGGIQALRNFKDVDDFMQLIYARPEYIDTLETSTAIAEHVPVDFELAGVRSTEANCSRSSGRS